MRTPPCPSAPVELSAAEIEAVSGGMGALAILAGAAAFVAAGALVAAVAVTADNAANGPLAGAWYRFTK
ncbi:MAG TPA: hypothetical protein PLN96_15565 [Zoogloea sp.]|uniref:hypothetical protein n=1 Tax=Zoogloea sp. TaxID=49181 RepID=UPI002B749C5C|nr:hypothetical protein [Zoogloea sp.]HMV18904.1 hypothetical protein [Rhodocyclaceae bacterium]HMV62079.1 hypothetical protein [Rhodocyclaceae bacterium]HMW52351.1 hypothetical protein [Rhodocyclaceae bacterium]HMY50952.1 hypothetical protein [Rhodocyclaceae bacterium]HMZ75527.1 hypothetical protein [Rhodocyclaceae bacterium]